MEVEEELHWLYVVCEVLNEDSAHAADIARQPLVEEPPEKEVMVYPHEIGHHVVDAFVYDVVLSNAQQLANGSVCVLESAHCLIVFEGHYCKANVVDVERGALANEFRVSLLDVPYHE